MSVDRGDRLEERASEPIEIIGRRRAVRLGIVLLVIGALGLIVFGSLAVGVDAQTEANATAPSEATSDAPEGVVAQVDENLRINDYYLYEENSTFVVVLENVGDRQSRVTVTEMIQADSSAGTFGIQELRVSEGETIAVQVDVTIVRTGAGVMVTTQRSIAEGSGEFVRVDSSPDFFDRAAAWMDVRAGIAAALGSIPIVALGVWQAVARRRIDIEPIDIDGGDR